VARPPRLHQTRFAAKARRCCWYRLPSTARRFPLPVDLSSGRHGRRSTCR
jgi:hypothetical protein